MFTNLTNLIRDTEEREVATHKAEAPTSRRVRVDVAAWGGAISVKIPGDVLALLGWSCQQKSFTMRGRAVTGVTIKRTDAGAGSHTLGPYPGNRSAARIQARIPGLTKKSVGLTPANALIKDGALHINPLPPTLLTRNDSTKLMTHIAATAPKSTLDDITAALALVNEARRGLPYPTEAFIDDNGDVKLRLTL